MTMQESDTRTRILAAAMGLFASRGYEATSIQQIIDAVGIAKGTFYHHFSGKDAMMAVLVEDMTSRVMEGVEAVLAGDLDPAQKFIRVFKVSGDIKLQDMAGNLPLLRQMRSGTNRLLESALADATRRRARPFFVRLLSEGREKGTFRIRDPGGCADIIIALGMGMKDESLDLLIRGLEGEPGALERFCALLDSCNDALERILGLEAGSLPVWDTGTIRTYMEGGRT